MAGAIRSAAALAVACLAGAWTAGCGPSSPPFYPGLDASRHDGSAPHDADAPDADSPSVGGADLDAGLDLDASADLDAAPDDGGTSMDADLDASATSADAAPPEDAALADAGPTERLIVRIDDPPTHPARPPIAPFTTCTVTTAVDTFPSADHRTPCTPIDYPYHPPAGGPHFAFWAAFETYDAPVPWGYLVHALEHGAVVLAYRCERPADCDAVRAEFASIIADRGVDPTCRLEATPSRIIVVPDPLLPVPIAAVAWQHSYRATCLDPASLRAFVDAHYAMAPEDFCFPGMDLSATAWCGP
jgi:hypothetical protein